MTITRRAIPVADPWRTGPAPYLDDPFTGSNGSGFAAGWGDSFGTFTQQNGSGQAVAGTSSYDGFGIYQPVPADTELLARWRITTGGSDVLTDFNLRDTAAGTYYSVRVSLTDVVLRKQVSGVGGAALGSAAQAQTVGVWYWTRLRVKGTNLRCKVWPDGTAEPTDWLVTGTDSAISATGKVGLAGEGSKTGGTPVTVLYDRVQVYGL